MNSSLRMDAASGNCPFCRLAWASLNDTSLTFIENVENAFSRVRNSGWGTGALAGGLGTGWSAFLKAVWSMRNTLNDRLLPFVFAESVGKTLFGNAASFSKNFVCTCVCGGVPIFADW